MSQLPPPPPAPPPGPSARSPSWPPVAPPALRRPSQWLPRILLVTAFVVIAGIAIGAWFRPLPDNKSHSTQPTSSYADQQIVDAKARVCAAYQKVHSAVGLSMARDLGSDPTAQLAVATAARQALLAGSEYLITTLSEEPATPPDLAAAVRRLATLFQNYTIEYLNGRTNSEIESSLRAGDETTLAIERLCK